MIDIRRESHAPPGGARAGSRPLYAIGDVHGCYDLLRAILAEIGRDLAERPDSDVPLLVFCGDYVDRGPESAKVLTALAWLTRSAAVETRLLEGNHEAVLRMFLADPTEHERWLAFGGRQTLESYGLEVPEVVDEEVLIALRDALLDAMPVSHEQLLGRLEPYVRVGDYAFVHAGVAPGVALERQNREDLLWIRDEFLDHPRPSPHVVVHGHTWADEHPTLLPHRIGIDTGAYETGVLTALRLADDVVEVIQAVADDTYVPTYVEPDTVGSVA
jgi:serine/threonine protein phosphatase 1